MAKAERCNSCGVPLIGKGAVAFPCPKCGETNIGRCANCREQAVEYVCEKCGFRGP